MYLIDHITFDDALRLTQTCKRLRYLRSSRMARRTELAKRYNVVDLVNEVPSMENSESQEATSVPFVVRLISQLSKEPYAQQYIDKIVLSESDDYPRASRSFVLSTSECNTQMLADALARLGFSSTLLPLLRKLPRMCSAHAQHALLLSTTPRIMHIEGNTSASIMRHADVFPSLDGVATAPFAALTTLVFRGIPGYHSAAFEDSFLQWGFKLPNLKKLSCSNLSTTLQQRHLPKIPAPTLCLEELHIMNGDISLEFLQSLMFWCPALRSPHWHRFPNDEARAQRWLMVEIDGVERLLADHGYKLLEKSVGDGLVFSL